MDLKFIEECLIKAKVINSVKQLQESGLRLHVDSENQEEYLVNLGPLNPYDGGCAENYLIDKQTGAVILESTERLEKVPKFD